jgi:hypothetical protein
MKNNHIIIESSLWKKNPFMKKKIKKMVIEIFFNNDI